MGGVSFFGGGMPDEFEEDEIEPPEDPRLGIVVKTSDSGLLLVSYAYPYRTQFVEAAVASANADISRFKLSLAHGAQPAANPAGMLAGDPSGGLDEVEEGVSPERIEVAMFASKKQDELDKQMEYDSYPFVPYEPIKTMTVFNGTDSGGQRVRRQVAFLAFPQTGTDERKLKEKIHEAATSFAWSHETTVPDTLDLVEAVSSGMSADKWDKEMFYALPNDAPRADCIIAGQDGVAFLIRYKGGTRKISLKKGYSVYGRKLEEELVVSAMGRQYQQLGDLEHAAIAAYTSLGSAFGPGKIDHSKLHMVVIGKDKIADYVLPQAKP